MAGFNLVNKCPLNEVSTRTLSLDFIIDKEDVDHTESYNLSRTFFTRFLGIVHFFYFLSIFNNIIPLIGSSGLYPLAKVIAEYTNELHTDHDFLAYLKKMPLLFVVLPPNDFFLILIPLLGVFVSFVPILTGISNWIITSILFLLLQTCVFAMNTFHFNVSHMMIVEATFLAIFLHRSDFFKSNSRIHYTPWSVRWGFKLFVFKALFSSGIVQLRTSASWSDLYALHNLLNSVTAPTTFTWIVDSIAAIPLYNKALTLTILFIECVFSIFVITPIRSCRLLAFFFTSLYSLFFYTLGGYPLFYLVLFASSLFLLDDKAMSWLFSIDVPNNSYDKPNEDYLITFSTENFSENFWNLFTTTPKVDEGAFTIPIIGYRISYNDFIRKVLDKIGSRIIFIKQLSLTLIMVSLLTFANIHWAFYVIVPIMFAIHCLTDFANFTFAYLTTFAVFIITSLCLFRKLMLFAIWQWIVIFVLFVCLVISLCKSCKWNSLVVKLFFEAIFSIFVFAAFKSYMDVTTYRYVDSNAPIYPYGIYNSVCVYPDIHRYRYELVIIATDDRDITNHTIWKEYEWKSKPGFINKSPYHIIPYERPLDNWIKSNHKDFAKLLEIYNKNKSFEESSIDPFIKFDKDIPPLVLPLLYKLSKGDEYVGSLFATNPFPKGAEHFKALLYSYHMSHQSQNENYNYTEITNEKLHKMMKDSRKHNYDPELGNYANYGTWWNRQPILIFTEYDLRVDSGLEELSLNSMKNKLRNANREELPEFEPESKSFQKRRNFTTNSYGNLQRIDLDFDVEV